MSILKKGLSYAAVALLAVFGVEIIHQMRAERIILRLMSDGKAYSAEDLASATGLSLNDINDLLPGMVWRYQIRKRNFITGTYEINHLR
jgi:hypothetical protein